MNDEMKLKLQAYLDGELSAKEAGEVAALMQQDSAALAMFGELKMTKTALVGNELELKLPEARAFYWSKIEREINRLELTEASSPKTMPWWRRFALPLGIAALILALAIPLGMRFIAGSSVESEAHDTSTYTIYAEDGNATVVWVNNTGN
jgi:anti-sigma factor RsiW